MIDKLIDDIVKTEGGFSDNKDDLGGATNYGITEVVARANGYHGPMRELPLSLARQIYKNRYYLEPKFDQVAVLSPGVAEELTDTGVNCGVSFAQGILQSALNLLNRQEKDYADIAEDKSIGKGTLAALAAYLLKRGKEGEMVLIRVLNIMQGARYIEITKTRPANETFFYGWVMNRVKV
jgi:lysozyme family protein